MLRALFYALLVRPITMIALGLNVRHWDRVRPKGSHLIVANHNSHLDALVLMSLFRLSDLSRVKVVAAKDYFCRNALTTWISLHLIGIVPIDRTGGDKDPLRPVLDSLDEGYTVILFPEGSRGEAEVRSPLKFGVAKLLEERPKVEVTPVYLYGLGKSLPRGETLLVPFVCEVNVGEPIGWTGDRKALIASIDAAFDRLAAEMAVADWR